MSKYDELVKKLKEIFQIDKPELDFGVYRILNARSVEITDYLENRLKAKVLESLSQAGSTNVENLKYDLAEAEKNSSNLGVSPDSVPKVKELRQKIAEYGAGSSEHENSVFSHLLTFFSRYYESGDFISQRRYKGDTYSIPYAGEEVMLHWANKDQHYTKSGENFSNYAFKLEDGRTVRFKLLAADTAKDNRKDNDKERRFVLIEEHVRTCLDDEGEEYEDAKLPLLEMDGELVIHFEYKAMHKGCKQEDEITKAVKTILENETVKTNWPELGKREPTESNPQRTILEKCLVNYTSKNTADYFIHKDLGGFLRGELDFYIKNEVMHLDDVQNAEKFSDIEKSLRLIQTLRSIALDLITFLSQLEEFQKKLWLKKKFVVATNYCVTLDLVPESLYESIAANEQQWNQWQAMGMLEGDKSDLFNQAKSGSVEYLKAHPFLMADTYLFDEKFKAALLASLDNLDESINGVLINSDNFQALNLLRDTYRNKINCFYIDPPYNTAASEIAYKNSYKHSSWMTMISGRLEASKYLMHEDAVSVVAIDDAEMVELCQLLDSTFSGFDRSMVVVNHHPAGAGLEGTNISATHEYAIFMTPSGKKVLHGIDQEDAQSEITFMRTGTAESNLRVGRPNSFYAVLVDPNSSSVVGVEQPPVGGNYPTTKDENGNIRIYPVSSDGKERVWRRSYESALNEITFGNIICKNSKTLYLLGSNEGKSKPIFSNWTDSKYNAGVHGTRVLMSMMGSNEFSYPKSIYNVIDCVKYATKYKDKSIIADYFAGSGTTGHAVIALNREDNGQRKYILVEQGEYFDTVTKPRIQKIVYSDNWKDGRAIDHHRGITQAIKVIKLESYEDALNNLQICRSGNQQDLLNTLSESAKDDYLQSYMLDIESSGSLMSVENFNSPFDFKLKVAVDSAGAYEERPIDTVETFNYLIGLNVKHIDMQYDKGFVSVIGELPNGEKTLVLWRDVNKVDYTALNKLCDKLAINPADNEFDIVYINGDHNIPSVFTATEAEGGVTKILKIRQIEPEFLSRMFAVDKV